MRRPNSFYEQVKTLGKEPPTRLTWLVAMTLFVSGLLAAVRPAVAADVDAHRFFREHCLQCHGPEKAKGGVNLTQLGLLGNSHAASADSDQPQATVAPKPIGAETVGAPQHAHPHWQTWESILEVLEQEQMPPEDHPQPGSAERQAMVVWIETSLQGVTQRTDTVVQQFVPRRLTNVEYQNTIRDLLGIELNLLERLPKDPEVPYRFNNSAEYLLMGLERMQRYEEIARRVMASAIVEPGDAKVHTARRQWDAESNNELAITGNRRGTPSEGLRVKSWPTTGEYRIRIQASAKFPSGETELPLRLVMGYSLASDIGNAPFETVGTAKLVTGPDEPQVFEFRGRIENHPWEPERQYRRGGTRTGNLVTTPAGLTITPQNLFDDGMLNDDLDPQTKPIALIDWMEFEAPVTDQPFPEHHRRILFDSPLRDSDPTAYISEVLRRFMTRAFRRPVTTAEVDRYVEIYQVFAADFSTMEAAVRETLAVVLISPHFLYLHAIAEPALADYELACRLSYFLWGSMPDQTLFDLAEQRRLHQPDVIAEQVRRLLADERAGAFLRNFTLQWLSIAKARSIPVNINLFPRFLYLEKRGQHANEEVPFRPTIRDDMIEETIAFVAELVNRNESVLNIIDSDFAILNQRLAYHYGVAGVVGHELRRVAIEPEHHLGGLLTQGSVLIANGTGSAPHPIYRAVWLREAILGDHVKPPPADVPALAESIGDVADNAVTIQDLLQQHRQKESCNDCHARLDPWGIPFEHYNAIGKFQPLVPQSGTKVRPWRKNTHNDLQAYNEYLQSIYTERVDARSKLPNGPEIDGLDELKAYLLANRSEQVARNVLTRLLTYGLGRELTYHDRFEVDALLTECQQSEYPLQDMIVAICQSQMFSGRKSP